MNMEPAIYFNLVQCSASRKWERKRSSIIYDVFRQDLNLSAMFRADAERVYRFIDS